MEILYLVHQNKSSLPELEAYSDFLKTYFSVFVVTFNEVLLCDTSKAFVWLFMGFSAKKINCKFLIHDYRSLSTGNFSRFKDKAKRVLNQKPNLRVFLNEQLKNEMHFNDGIPSIIIDMGIRLDILKRVRKPDAFNFDYVYVGDISPQRNSEKLIKFLLSNYSDKKIAVVGSYDKSITDKFPNNHITYFGKISIEKVYEIINVSRICICYIPNKYPYNIQTPTKLLEYIAFQKEIILNFYPLVEKICRKFELELSLNSNSELLNASISPKYLTDEHLELLNWEKILQKSGLLDEISSFIEK